MTLKVSSKISDFSEMQPLPTVSSLILPVPLWLKCPKTTGVGEPPDVNFFIPPLDALQRRKRELFLHWDF